MSNIDKLNHKIPIVLIAEAPLLFIAHFGKTETKSFDFQNYIETNFNCAVVKSILSTVLIWILSNKKSIFAPFVWLCDSLVIY